MKAILPVDCSRLGRRAYSARHAFGVDPKRPERYRLRLARYVVLAQDISDWAGDAALAGRTLSVLDVGCGWGPLLCQLEAEPHFHNIRISAADRADRGIYKREIYREFFIGDLTGGYPEIESERYDVVVCEQVLEHLDALDAAISTLARVTRPCGILVIGVPIFFPPLHLAQISGSPTGSGSPASRDRQPSPSVLAVLDFAAAA
jgi:2-polyprenyl-3-methyl-5-hydroxy-6-metoxy-1,4-benzoquinol methylase